MAPSKAIKLKTIIAKSSAPTKLKKEERLPSNVGVRYLYQPGELEGGERRRATDPIWSLDVYRIERAVFRQNGSGQPILYYLSELKKGTPKRGFVHEELLVVPINTELPPDGVL